MLDASTAPNSTSTQLAEAIVKVVSQVPPTREAPAQVPRERAAQIAKRTQRRTAAVSAAAALPPGPLGWLTLLPEAVAVWRMQAQMVSDIAGAYGRSATLTPELMLHCLFQHAANRAMGGLVVRVGERVLVHRLSLQSLQPVARAVAMRITQRTVARGIARWVPGVGSVVVGTYAWFDTGTVARTAMDLFSRPIDVKPS